MIEESFLRLYARDFVHLATRAGLGQPVDALVTRRVAEARTHAGVMDLRKGDGHLSALAVRLREEGDRFDTRSMRHGDDPHRAARDHLRFLQDVADQLSAPPVDGDGAAWTDIPRKRRRS